MKRLSVAVVLFACFAAVLPAQTTIFLVRHAEKAQASAGNAKDPDLSKAGRARAEALARILKDAHIKFVYVSEFKRTRETAKPSARTAGVKVTVVPANDASALLSKLKNADGNVLVVGHSNTLPEIIKALGVSDPVVVDDADYDNLFVLTRSTPPRLLRLHYASCSR